MRRFQLIQDILTLDGLPKGYEKISFRKICKFCDDLCSPKYEPYVCSRIRFERSFIAMVYQGFRLVGIERRLICAIRLPPVTVL